jgi:AcrR family transcriptional regulator
MGAQTLRALQRTETRQRILLAACQLFGQTGPLAVRTQDVATAAGVSHGSVFAHFKTRDALIAAVVDETVVGAANQVRHELRLARGPEAVLHAHLRALAEHEGVYAKIVAERQALPVNVQARLVEVNSGVATYLLDSLQREAPLRVAPHFAFNAWLALVHYYLLNRDLFTPGRSVLTERADELVQNYLALMR